MDDVYDYVIVGAGSAGCVLANRLSADPACRVLLLEAGGSADVMQVQTSFGFANMRGNPKFDWCFTHGPEPGMQGRRPPYPRGRILGGSSSINAMLYVRGLRRDYDAWAAEGLADWGWAGVEPFLRRLEDYPFASPYPRGVGGPTKVTPAPNMHPLSRRLIRAAGECGVGASEDYNGPDPSGLGQGQLFYRDGRRSGSAAAYLKPVSGRANLRVVTGAVARALVFDGARVTGVRYRQGEHDAVATGRETILSAGAIGSPQLLELSGIGDGAVLQAAGITPRHHLPAVGGWLQDHCIVSLAHDLVGVIGMGRDFSGWRVAVNAAAYMLFKRGPLNGTFAQVTGHADVVVAGETVGLQLMGSPLSLSFAGATGAMKLNAGPAVMMMCNVCVPRSRGYSHVVSDRLEDQPAIVTNMLMDARDLQATVEGIRLCRTILQQAAFDGVRGEEQVPGAGLTDDEGLREYVRSVGATAYHPVGTCRMSVGPENGVVDGQLRVHGVDGLRVVDASVMPSIVSANTHAPTVMIAEKAAELLRN